MNLKHQFHRRRLGSRVQEESAVRFRSHILLKRELCCEDEKTNHRMQKDTFLLYILYFEFFSPPPTLSDYFDADGNLRESF